MGGDGADVWGWELVRVVGGVSFWILDRRAGGHLGWDGRHWRYDIGISGAAVYGMRWRRRLWRMYKAWSRKHRLHAERLSDNMYISCSERGVLHCIAPSASTNKRGIYTPSFFTCYLPGHHLPLSLVSTSFSSTRNSSLDKPHIGIIKTPPRQTNPDTYSRPKRKQASKKNTTKNRQNSSLIERPPPLPPSHPHLKRTASSSPDASHPPSSPRRPHPTDSTPQSWSARAPAAPCGG